ncbi:NERD domain-containing protein [Actinoallomurus purpureus]|uniref:nuclease-related domain-containing protein n=1 Tax=Actinoallomurus purpureus TaxID=478114 RepID=UPI0020928BEA|nr:nuclease-related domain-containing protein [Actinoallomurus purpureus]MCO6003894.1 NERD domain-containing protein [Actinoallomurus purpureus]
MFGGSIYVPDNPALTGGSPQAVHEQLWAQGKRRRLQVRGALAALGLVIGTVLVDFWFGLLAAAVIALVDTLYYLRQRIASSAWRKGQRGERRTSALLRLTLDWRGYRVLQGRNVPGQGQIDHLVIGPTGVLMIDNQAIAPDTDIAAYKGTLFVDERSGAKMAAALRERADATAALLAERLGGEVAVEAVAVIHGGHLARALVEADGVTLIRAHRLPGWIRRQRNRFSPEEVATIADAAHRLPISRQAIVVR